MAVAMAIGCLALYIMNINIVPTNGMGEYQVLGHMKDALVAKFVLPKYIWRIIHEVRQLLCLVVVSFLTSFSFTIVWQTLA